MKANKFLALLFISSLFFMACSSDDSNPPAPVNEEEVITTFIVTLTPQGGGTNVVLSSIDLDGDGPNAPVIEVTGDPLVSGTTYNGTMQILNATVDPADNVLAEIQEEDDAHQFFYTFSAGLPLDFQYTNFDANGNPLGTQFTATAQGVGGGSVTFTLLHDLNKFALNVANGNMANAAGDTDLEVTFTGLIIM